MNRLVLSASGSVRGRVLIVDKSGIVLSDSGGAEAVGSDYSSRPEISVALRGESDQLERSSDTLGTRILATADPIFIGDRVVGAVRITQSVDAVNSTINRSLLGLGLLALLVMAFALMIAAVIANQISRPIRRLEATARRFATGGLEETAEVTGSREQRSLARSFNEMTSRVERLLQSQTDFVASASHQLRTPLTGLRLRIEGLRDETGDPEDRKELDASLREVDRLSKMVDELLVLSRAGEVDVPGEILDLKEVTREAHGRWLKASGSRDLLLTGMDRGDIGTVFCARADLDRILDALIENAVNYSPENSEVGIDVRPSVIRILDQGEGLERGEEELVFERFTRGKSGKQGVSGTGLGLSIAKELARPWGANVTIETRAIRGAMATVDFSQQQSDGPVLR